MTVCCDPGVGVGISFVGVTGDGLPEMLVLELQSSVWDASMDVCEFSTVESSFEGEPSWDDSKRARMADSVESCRVMSDRSVSLDSHLLHGHACEKKGQL